jgi:hypothetical protein
VSWICGGPSPILNGELTTAQYVSASTSFNCAFTHIDLPHSSIHRGVTVDEHPVDFGGFAHDMFNNDVIPIYIDFLNKVFRKCSLTNSVKNLLIRFVYLQP